MKVGQRVKVIGEEIYGKVLRVHQDTCEVVIKDEVEGFELVYKPRDLKEVRE